MAEVVITVLGLGLLIVGGMSFVFSIFVISMSSDNSKLTAIDLQGDSNEIHEMSEVVDWAAENGFEWIDAYWGHFPFFPVKPLILAWRNQEGTYLAAYKAGELIAVDFLTRYSMTSQASMTSSRTQAGQAYPSMPDCYSQQFKEIDLPALHRLHNEALNFLRNKYSLIPVHSDEPFEQSFLGFLRDHMIFVRSIPLWPLKVIFWQFKKKQFLGIPATERYAQSLT